MSSHDLTFDQWLAIGRAKGWVGPVVCSTHDGIPTTRAEDDAWFDGDDPCVHVARFYDCDDTRREVEENHPPSLWRGRQ